MTRFCSPRAISKTRPGRKVLVIVTDGGDTTSQTDFNRATEAAATGGCGDLPDAGGARSPMTPGRNIGGENALTTFAQRTGGRVFAPTLGAEMDSAFDQILRDLRTQYLLGFYPKNVPLTKDRFHALQVAVQDPGLRVIARSGYYGEAQQAGAPAYSGSSSALAGPGQNGETVRPKKPQPAKQVKGPKANRAGIQVEKRSAPRADSRRNQIS